MMRARLNGLRPPLRRRKNRLRSAGIGVFVFDVIVAENRVLCVVEPPGTEVVVFVGGIVVVPAGGGAGGASLRSSVNDGGQVNVLGQSFSVRPADHCRN
jgi:hypothetical protein